MKVTVKIAPHDGSWQTACNLIKQIAANPVGEMEFIVEDVFNNGSKKISVGNNSSVYVGNGNNVQQNLGGQSCV